MRNTYQLLPVSLMLLVLLSACSGSSSNDAVQNRPIPRVEVAPIEYRSLSNRLSSSGTISAKNEVKITAQTDGKIEELTVEEGSVVREGQILIKLDATIADAQYREAEASLRESRQNYERAQQLFERRLISDQEYLTLQTRMQIAESRYQYQHAILEYTTIRAPISGVITFRGVDRGDVATIREHVLTITNLDHLVILVHVSELDIPHLSIGDRVAVQVDALRGSEFDGVIRRIFPVANPDTRLVPVEVELTSRDSRLFPGMFARAAFQTERRERTLAVPVSAVLTNPRGGNFIYIVNDSTAHYREIKPGLRTERFIEIMEGVSEHEKVVVAGAGSLTDGMPVRITAEREEL